ncbi:cupin domain-containing protein [Allosaccharopolyspora coralli]|uniref:Cupin domain-containing protein n=1 Tax=Allosaccharopolyspora coralli TaxID=2665642 RepID=A0A5Q3QCL4_9PSEU|nr:cysteine dioxygenase family protein [Allosaccharopolyspora coralli]QGK71086.1 cupin domain-containing protein [Allosaccharopolyspora coralli]
MFAVPPNTVAHAADTSLAHPARIAKQFAEQRDTWAHLLRYDPDERWMTLIERTASHEVWLMSWLPGQHTTLHDHGGATGAFTVVTGRLSERVVVTGGRSVEALHTVSPGQSRVFGPHYVHQVRNEGEDPAVSLHVYRPSRVPMRTHG